MFFCKYCGKSSADIRENALHENACVKYPETISHHKVNVCKHCGKNFDRSFNCRRHQAACERRLTKLHQTTCEKCKKKCRTFLERKRHESDCNDTARNTVQFVCHQCNEKFDSATKLISHENETEHNLAGGSGTSTTPAPDRTLHRDLDISSEQKKVKCSVCKGVFANRKELYHHKMLEHKQSSEIVNSLQPVPWTDNPIWEDESGNINETLRRTYEQHRHLILRGNAPRQNEISSIYNFPLDSRFSLMDLMSHVQSIYDTEHVSFKINLSFGTILQNINTEEFRYFVPYFNQNIFNRPLLINNRADLERLREKLSRLDVKAYILKQRGNTAWKPYCITNVNIEIYRTNFPLGNTPVSLPNYIIRNRSIISFQTNPHTKKAYTDFLCFFRCLAFHIKHSPSIEKFCKELHAKWKRYVDDFRLKSYDITLRSMPDIEKCFNINIHVYTLSEKGVALARYKSFESISNTDNRKDVMYLNMHEQHLSYITNFKAYSKKFQCAICSKMFALHYKCKVHERTCKSKTNVKLPGGFYSLPKSVFDTLDEYSISVDKADREYPWFITYDFESLLLNESSCHKWHTTHKPVSVSICSNVEGYEHPKFILDENLDSLLSQMINYMKEIGNKAYSLAKRKWEKVFIHLDKLDDHWGKSKENIDKNKSHSTDLQVIASDDESEQMMETDEYDPPSEDFVNALKKENVFYSALKRLQETEKLQIEYNNWGINENHDNEDVLENNKRRSRSSSSSSSSSSGRNSSSSSSSRRGSSRSSSSSSSNRIEYDDKDNVSVSISSSSSSSSSRRSVAAGDDDNVSVSISSSSSSSRRSVAAGDDDIVSVNSSSSSSSFTGGDNDDASVNNKRRSSKVVVVDDDDDDDDDDNVSVSSSCSSISHIKSCFDQVDSVSCKDTEVVQVKMINLLKYLRQNFEEFCQQIPCLGFNSSKYDLNLMKEKLAKHLNMHLKDSGKKFVVKRNNAYMCIANKYLRFLDMLAYLPPATSYDKFLKTFEVKTRKSFFPYEYFSTMAVLKETCLPPKEAFYSRLKQKNVLENDLFISYSSLRKQGKTKHEAFELLKLKPEENEPESSIEERYNALKTLWETENFLTMKDYLQYYNNLDALPFVEGIKAFKKFFTQNNIDVFKDCISIPGVARKMLFETGIKNGAVFSLIDPSDVELYTKMKNGIVGGPSIIFNRFHKKDETFIRSNKNKPSKSILGLDFNSLYLHSIMQPMCVGKYERRKKEDNFKPILRQRRYTSMFDWLDFVRTVRNIDIKHKQNYGKELRVGPYLIDGFENGTKHLFEFLGCWWHGHDCEYVRSKLTDKERQTRFEKHETKMKFLHDNGYNVECIWECQYRSDIKTDKNLKDFIQSRKSKFHKKFPREVTVEQILESVVDDTLFGFVEVSIEVPDSFEKSMFKPSTHLSPEQYFSEMSPIFCTTEIPIDCIGEHMKQFVEENKLSQKPRKLLVGGMKAEKIFLATPLLKWYLHHGLVVTDIFEVVEYSKLACFKEFGEAVTAARRKGDIDPSLEIIGMLNKLIGNSAFGGTIIDQEKFSLIKYVHGFKQACHSVNNVRFKTINELDDEFYESEFARSKITINTAIQIGNMILQYSKLRLLQFYYDWLDVNVDRGDFELTECDTDSLYMALSERSLDDVVKPDLKEKYLNSVTGSFVCRDDFSGDENTWFTRKCCEKHSKYDSRTPGVLKVEFSGEEMISVSSKAYAAKSNQCIKYSMKGINKTITDPFPMYMSVLNTRKNITGVNRGFRVFENKVRTYEQTKTALNYFYCKRQVLNDGIHTVPLSLTLKPVCRTKENNEDWL